MDVAFIVALLIISASFIMEILSLIKPKNSLLTKQLNSKVFKALYEELVTFDGKKELCRDLEFIALSCNLAEYLVDQQKKHLKGLKIDKLALVVNVFDVIYCLSESDKEDLRQKVQFVVDNEMVKKVSAIRYLKKRFSTWISKQL